MAPDSVLYGVVGTLNLGLAITEDLVRRHGVYVWGPTWQKAKTMTECYDYLFEIAVKMRQMVRARLWRAPRRTLTASQGLDPAAKPPNSPY